MDLASQVLTFGDQATNYASSFKRLHELSRHSAVLDQFLRVAAETLQTAAEQDASPSKRGLFQASLLELCEPQWQEESQNVAVSTVMACINQLGWLLFEASEDVSLLRPNEGSVLLGACTGSIAATAAACATSATELLTICPHFVVVALRIGLAALYRSDNIEPSIGNWTIAVFDISHALAQSMLDEFHESQSITVYRQAYVSAHSWASTSISGPPPTLRLLLANSAKLRHLRVVQVPISGAFHAQHLDVPDFESIVDHSGFLGLRCKPEVSVIFGSGRKLECSDMTPKSLLYEAWLEIFQRCQDSSLMEKTIGLCTQPNQSRISFIGPSSLQTRLERLLKPIQVRNHAASAPCKLAQNPTPLDKETDIAVVGMSGRFPGSNDVEELWKVLSQGQDLCQQIPTSRFAVNSHYDPSGRVPNTTLTQYGCFYDQADLFDALLFHMSPRQANQTDPIQRLILMTTYEALEQAGFSYEGMNSHNIGTFVGQSSDDWREVNAAQSIDAFHIPGGNRAFVSGRVNYHFGWEGPAFGIDTACSSSAASIDLACSALLSNKCDSAIAGGGNIMTASDIFAGLSRGGLLSPTGSCKTWDETADGYCRADAVGVVVLKRLKTAIANRDNVLAILKSTATNHSAQASSITHPHAETQARLVHTVLKEANVSPSQVDYVEMHGTGTQAGDVAETSSIYAVFGNQRTSANPLYIGTIKPNVGHGEAASGITSVIKAIMMLRKSRIPRHIGIKTVRNKNLPDLHGSNILIPSVEIPFPQLRAGQRNILVNNFNITSGNTSILIGDGFRPVSEGKDPRSAQVVAISAHSPAALRGNLYRLELYLSQNPGISLPDLAYSTTARRMHHHLRQAYAIKHVPQLLAAVKADLEQTNLSDSTAQPAPVIFVFTGQASQYAGMSKVLFDTSSIFRDSILRSERTCKTLGLPSFTELITSLTVDMAVFDTTQSQLALVALEVALAELWQSWGVEPLAVIGHSLGEYPAFYVAGVYSLADMFYLVGRRACLLQKTCISGGYSMLSVRLAAPELEPILRQQGFEECEIACHNTPESNVIAGPSDQINKLACELEQKRHKSTLLQLPYAFHSAQMDPLLEEFEGIAAEIPFEKPSIVVASTVKAAVIREGGSINANYFAQHTRNLVRFDETIRELESQGLAHTRTLWLEIGPGSVCTNMIKNILDASPERCLISIACGQDDWETLATSLAKAYRTGVDIKWRQFHREYETALHLLELPAYAFDLKSYWIPYEGDWCVRKGRPNPNAATTSPLRFTSTTLQKIDREEFGADSASMVFSSDLHEERLNAAIVGHLVNDSGLCPSSIYADMAITAASYIFARIRPSEKILAFDVSSMNVQRPLILNQSASTQMINVSATKESRSSEIKMSVTSSDRVDSVLIHHADWIVVLGDSKSWADRWAKDAYLYQSRIDSLKISSSVSQIHHLLGPMVYKLFSVLVAYGPKYRGIQEAFLDGKSSEATARVLFQSSPTDGDFACSPYWIDSLAHLSGFVLNGSDTTPQDVVYISHGWDSMRFTQPLAQDCSYTTYVKMQKTGEKGVMAGDVRVLYEGVVIGVVAGLRFQKIKKTVLSALLPKRDAQAPVVEVSPVQPKSLSRLPNRKADTRAQQVGPIDRIPAVVALVAAELGVDPVILSSDAILADLGADSLMIIEIQSKARSQLNIDIPALLFTRSSTMGDLKRYVEKIQGSDMVLELSNSSNFEDSKDISRSTLTNAQSKGLTPSTSLSEKTLKFKHIIADELGVSVTDIEPHANLMDLGVDSMLTFSIINSVRSLTGQDIPANFFISYPTLADVEGFFETAMEQLDVTAASVQTEAPKMTLHSKTSAQSTNIEAATNRIAQPPISCIPAPRCGTTLLHFPMDTTIDSPTLVLLPDGAGSPAPYTRLPTLHPALRALGLTSPFLTNPAAYTLPLSDVASFYVDTIKQAAPTGPLILGGYSIGGIFAHEAAKQLLEQGREVSGLLFLDTPCPPTVPAMKPESLVGGLDVLEQLGTFNWAGRTKDVNLAPNVREHFYRSAVALEEHVPSSSSAEARRLPCEAIWARKGVLESLKEDETVRVKAAFRGESPARDWLLKRRKSVGPQGWEEFFDGEVRCGIVDTDHFSLFKEPNVSDVARLMTAAITRILGEK